MKEIEVNARTVDEAVQTALTQLGVDKNQVKITIKKKGRSGVLGMGSEEASIIVKLLDKPQKGNKVSREAKDVLEKLIKHLGLIAEVNVIPAPENGLPMTLNIDGDDLGVLIGRRGQALASLQYIVRLIVAGKIQKWVPINVDVAGYKNRRYKSLRNLALRLADQVKTNRHSINLEHMPADERRIIHMTLANHPDVSTQSEGEGDKRKVVVMLRNR